jgi:tyrosyl-tRNA synthetase
MKFSASSDVPSTELEKSKLESDDFTRRSVLSGLAPSKGATARRRCRRNNLRADDARKAITMSEFIDGQVLRKGAKNYHVIRIVSEARP